MESPGWVRPGCPGPPVGIGGYDGMGGLTGCWDHPICIDEACDVLIFMFCICWFIYQNILYIKLAVLLATVLSCRDSGYVKHKTTLMQIPK